MKDRYEIEKELGRGGMGAVFLARDRLLGRAVALKVIQGTAGKQEVERFVREARATGALDHPAFVPTYTLNRDGSNLFFTMEPVEGRTLANLLSSGALPLREAVRALADVAQGVAYAHERGLVHRDLKPGNVMLSPAGNVRILDWGLVRLQASSGLQTSGFRLQKKEEEKEETAPVSHRLTAAGSVMGTPAYMSPEQAAGDLGAIGPATDIYALGAILYEILAGSPPHQGSFKEIAQKLSRGDLESPSSRAPGREVPRELEAVAMKAMAREPALRYESAFAAGQDLVAWLEGRNVSVLLPPLPVRAARWVARHALVSTALALVLVLSLAVGLYLHHRDRREAAEREAAAEGARADRIQEIQALEDRAAACQDRAREAHGAWQRAFREWSSARRMEDELFASLPVLPAMEPGEDFLSYVHRTQAVMGEFDWERYESFVASREKGQATLPDSSAARRGALVEARDELELAVVQGERSFHRLLVTAEKSGTDDSTPADRDPARNLIELARLRLDAAIQEALAEDAEGTRQGSPALLYRLRLVAASYEALASGADRDSDLAKARRILAGRERVAIGALPGGASGTLYRLTGEPLWARARPDRFGATPDENGTLVEDPMAGLAAVAEIPASGCEGDLPTAEYLLVLARDGREVRIPFLLLRARPVEIQPVFPDDFPPGTLYVPAGWYFAGGEGLEALPRHQAAVAEGFFIQEHEVSIADYAEFMRSVYESAPWGEIETCMPRVLYTDHVDPLFERQADGSLGLTDETVDWDHPIFGLSYYAAAAYARWRTERDPRKRFWRLPTTLEWEYAAGGPSGRAYPWGERFEKARLVCLESRGEGYFAPVLSHPAGRSVFGARHLAGNAREWTASACWNLSVLTRGGSWTSDERETMVAARTGLDPISNDGAGVRLVCVPEP
ncbi:MAG: SUMF1/EgtB/PvdO family nonheme iron enzyme [Planctomycetes bacterium]|nr:SUMF1/EgtB/PvdO family nonheme iron enzyme [Planctomycetota bacterium]